MEIRPAGWVLHLPQMGPSRLKQGKVWSLCRHVWCLRQPTATLGAVETQHRGITTSSPVCFCAGPDVGARVWWELLIPGSWLPLR